MAPIRGFKRRKKVEKEVDQNAAVYALPYRSEPSDWWNEFSRRITTGSASEPPDSTDIETFLKMSRKTFDYITSLVSEEMMAKPANFMDLSGKLLSLNDRVAVALRRLSSGDSLSVVGESLGLNQTTVSQITWRFVEGMEKNGLHHLRWPSTGPEMEKVKSGFLKFRGLPNCCGALDTTHILMCLSSGDEANNVWCDTEKNHSMLLQAIVGPDMRFLDVVTGWPGSISNSLAFRSSTFFKLAEERKRLNGKVEKLYDGTEVPEYVIGDLGFPLVPWLLTPYQGRELSDYELNFNRKLLSTRKVAQRALGRLKDTWRIINGVMWRPDKNKLPRIVLVCCLLHNIAIDLEDEVQDKLPCSNQHDSGYRQQVCDIRDERAVNLRDVLSLSIFG